MAAVADLRVTVLRDNLAPQGLRAGHGLALLLQTPLGSVLLDTGDSPQTWENADALGVDLERVQCLALSHGHYDHTGGIEGLLQRRRGLRIVAHPAVFEPRWAVNGAERYIGPPLSRAELEGLGATVELTTAPVELAPGVTTTGQVPRDAQDLPGDARLRVERAGRLQPDDFIDDLSLVVRLKRAGVVVTGCAHAGLLNIVAQAQRLVEVPVRALIGGTHLLHTPGPDVTRQAQALHASGLRYLAPLHCTGESGRDALRRHFPGKFLLAQTGDTIVAQEDGELSISAH